MIHVWTRTSISIGVLCFLSVIALTLAFPEIDSTIILLIVGLVFLGMPHGAMDIFLAYRILKKSLPVRHFVLGYLLVASLIVALWLISPTFSFLFFLLYSLFHFADSDLQKPILESKLSFVEFLARLPLPFCLSLIFFEEKTLQLIQVVHPSIEFQSYLIYFQFLGYIGLTLTSIFLIFSFINFLKNFRSHDLTFLEPLVLVVLFSQLTPLYAFAIYFCFVHAVKHLVNVVTKIEVKSLKTLLPFWLLPLVGLAILFFAYSFSESYRAESFQKDLFQYIIVILSVLAFPHAIMIRYCKMLKIIS